MKGKRQRSYQERVMQIKNVLRTFYSERGMAPTQADISEAIEVSKPMVTYLLGRMSRDGIIENRGWQVVPRTREQKALKSRDYVAHGSPVNPLQTAQERSHGVEIAPEGVRTPKTEKGA